MTASTATPLLLLLSPSPSLDLDEEPFPGLLAPGAPSSGRCCCRALSLSSAICVTLSNRVTTSLSDKPAFSSNPRAAC